MGSTGHGAEGIMKTGVREGPGIWGSMGWLILFFFLQGLTSVAAGAMRATEVGPENVVLDARMGHLLAIALCASGMAIIALRHRKLASEVSVPVHKDWWKVAGMLLLAMLAFHILYSVFVIGGAAAQPEMQIFADATRLGIVPAFIVFATLVFIAPIAEEILFRGQLQPAVERRFGPWPAIIAPAVLFGAVHLQPLAAIPLIVTGILLGWLRWKTGSILVPIVFHVLMNALAFAGMLLVAGQAG